MTDDFAETGAVPFRMTRMMTMLLSSVGVCPCSPVRSGCESRQIESLFQQAHAWRTCASESYVRCGSRILLGGVWFRSARGLLCSSGRRCYGAHAPSAHAQAPPVFALARGNSCLRVPTGDVRQMARGFLPCACLKNPASQRLLFVYGGLRRLTCSSAHYISQSPVSHCRTRGWITASWSTSAPWNALARLRSGYCRSRRTLLVSSKRPTHP